jgi:hypothetical protein
MQPYYDTSQPERRTSVVILCFKTLQDFENGKESIERMEESEIRIPSSAETCSYQIKLIELSHKRQCISLASSSDLTLSTGITGLHILFVITKNDYFDYLP